MRKYKDEVTPFNEADERKRWAKLSNEELIEELVDATESWHYWEAKCEKAEDIKQVQITAEQVGELNAYKVFFDRLHPNLLNQSKESK